MFAKNKEESSGVIPYAKSVLTYTLFSETDQNNEYDLIWNGNGFVFIPIYPITYVIDEAFYNKLFTILNLALTPQNTLIRPLTMHVVTLDNRQSKSCAYAISTKFRTILRVTGVQLRSYTYVIQLRFRTYI